MFLKKLILVVSPPACGKTYVSKKLATALHHVVYLDKDTLIPLSKKIFEAANEEYNRSSDFFNRVIRDVEYVKSLAKKLAEKNAELTFVWVEASSETCHQRMLERNSSRDTWKMTHWDEYIKGVDFSIPTPLANKDTGCKLLVFNNNVGVDFDKEMEKLVKQIQK